MDPYFKFFITIVAIVVTFVKCRHIKDKRKRIIVIMAILLAISIFSNRSIYWFLYWDGPYHGQVVDADTGEGIEGAAVAKMWSFDYIFFFIGHAFFSGETKAQEILSDVEGRFKLPIKWSFSPWPFVSINRYRLLVFKSGYDTHPPTMQRSWTHSDEQRRRWTKRKYRNEFKIECKEFKKCLVRLNKATYIKERLKACTSLHIDYLSSRQKNKIKNFINLINIERRRFEADEISID